MSADQQQQLHQQQHPTEFHQLSEVATKIALDLMKKVHIHTYIHTYIHCCIQNDWHNLVVWHHPMTHMYTYIPHEQGFRSEEIQCWKDLWMGWSDRQWGDRKDERDITILQVLGDMLHHTEGRYIHIYIHTYLNT